MMRIELGIRLWWLLALLSLIPVACNAPESLTGINIPEGVAGRFITACLASDWATALELLTPETREAVLGWGGGNSCSDVSVGADSAVLAASELTGKTARVAFEWPGADGTTVQYQLLLTEVDGAWRIFDDRKSHRRPAPVPVTPSSTIAPSTPAAGEER